MHGFQYLSPRKGWRCDRPTSGAELEQELSLVETVGEIALLNAQGSADLGLVSGIVIPGLLVQLLHLRVRRSVACLGLRALQKHTCLHQFLLARRSANCGHGFDRTLENQER